MEIFEIRKLNKGTEMVVDSNHSRENVDAPGSGVKEPADTVTTARCIGPSASAPILAIPENVSPAESTPVLTPNKVEKASSEETKEMKSQQGHLEIVVGDVERSVSNAIKRQLANDEKTALQNVSSATGSEPHEKKTLESLFELRALSSETAKQTKQEQDGQSSGVRQQFSLFEVDTGSEQRNCPRSSGCFPRFWPYSKKADTAGDKPGLDNDKLGETKRIEQSVGPSASKQCHVNPIGRIIAGVSGFFAKKRLQTNGFQTENYSGLEQQQQNAEKVGADQRGIFHSVISGVREMLSRPRSFEQRRHSENKRKTSFSWNMFEHALIPRSPTIDGEQVWKLEDKTRLRKMSQNDK